MIRSQMISKRWSKLNDRDKGTASGEQPNECKVWGRLIDRIDDLFLIPDFCFFCDVPPTAKWVVGRTDLSFATDLHRAEKPFRTEIESAIRALCSGQSVSISPEVRYFLAVRGRVVRWFLSSFEIDQRGRPDIELSQTIIPFPDGVSPSEILIWFMFHWWNNNGADIAALLELREEHMNPMS
jgi:hypothetical protein